MKPEPMDRRRLFGPVPDVVHDRLQTTLSSLKEDPPMRKIKLQPILIALLILLLCGVAIAAVTTWDVRTLLTRTDDDGREIVNEALVEQAQPIGRTYEGKALSVTVTDALFDGKSLIAAWTLTNTTDDLLYLTAEPTEDSVPWMDGGGALFTSHEFIHPGETREGMMDFEIVDPPLGDTLPVGIRFTALRIAVPYQTLPFPEQGYVQDGEYILFGDADERMAAFEAETEALEAEGVFILHGAEYPYLTNGFYMGDLAQTRERLDAAGTPYTDADALMQTGRFALSDTLDVTFTLRVTPSLARSLLAEGAPPQRAYDGFTLRVTRADLYPGTLDLLVEVVFEDEAMARRWTDLHDPTTPCVVALNPQGQLDWSDSYTFGVPTLRPDPLPDGRWVAECPISYSSILRLPEHVVICPRVVATNLENEGPYWIITALPGQEEGIVLPLP